MRRAGRPPIVARPASGRSRPRIIRIVVDLPEPFGPRNPVTEPGCTVKLRLSTARTGPYFLLRPLASIMTSPWPRTPVACPMPATLESSRPKENVASWRPDPQAGTRSGRGITPGPPDGAVVHPGAGMRRGHRTSRRC